jgi:transcription initiation factor TFIIIB Brf1 subunit/transcription initiation factor TFIIB
MSTEEKIRETIVTGLRAGRSVPEIVKFNNLKKSTVRDVKRRYDAFIAARRLQLQSDRKIHKKRSDSLGVDIVARLQELVDQDPSRSIRSLARELDISEFVVRKKMAQDICYKSYALKRGQF